MRKEKNLRTYGRHKNIVIVPDIWISDSDKKQAGVFSTSSDDSSRQASVFQSSSSSENGAQSLNSTGNSDHSLFSTVQNKVQSRCAKKAKQAADKENEEPRRQRRKQESSRGTKKELQVPKQIFSLSSSSEHSVSSENKSNTRALRDRNQKVDYNDSANMKKQLRGMTAKRKKPVRTCNKSKTCKESSVNFSDFDSYSLIISDSPPVDAVKGNTLLSVETSTPVAKRTRYKGADDEKMKVTDISHIEMVDSPAEQVGFQGIDTPESAHSQSLFNTPSVLSSDCSEDVSDWSKKTGESVTGLNGLSNRASVRLQRLRGSFIQSALSGNSKSNKTENRANHINTRSQRFNNSESLFSSPEGNLEKNVSLLTERLKQVRCGQLYDDSVAEEATSVSESEHFEDEQEDENSVSKGDIDESDEADDSDGDDTPDDSSDFQNADLSAIAEDEEASEEESDEDDNDDARNDSSDESNTENESDSDIESDFCKRVTRNKKKTPMERLSESLLMNHVNRRRTTKNGKKGQNSAEMDDLADCLENSHLDSSDSNCTLYMLNDDGSLQSRKSRSVDLSVYMEEDSEEDSEVNDSESKDGFKSAYYTARSSRHSEGDYHTAEEEEEDHSDDNDNATDEESRTEDIHCTPARKKYSLRDKFQHLQNSFSEILSPKRKKNSLVPLSAQARVLVMCDQTEAITFRAALSAQMISQCKKIGEGVYGEVFRSYNSEGQSVAIKIIPIEGDFEVNDEQQKKFSEILPEVVIAKELSNLRDTKSSMTSSFCQVYNVSLVKGAYPAQLIREWDEFHKNKHSENDRPDVFPKRQLYIVFEFADCGTDLESYKFDTIQQAKSVLSQVAYALAVAEETLQFEHRDLHWGNVLVRPTEKENISYRLLGKPVSVPSQGVEASVIDFTMSRVTKDGLTVYVNIPDEDTLFQGEGDYQFDIYREMKKENKGNWEKFCPHSNVLWLHYLADKLVYSTKYPDQSARQEREVLREFRQFMSTMLKYRSACDMVVDSLFLNS